MPEPCATDDEEPIRVREPNQGKPGPPPADEDDNPVEPRKVLEDCNVGIALGTWVVQPNQGKPGPPPAEEGDKTGLARATDVVLHNEGKPGPLPAETEEVHGDKIIEGKLVHGGVLLASP